MIQQGVESLTNDHLSSLPHCISPYQSTANTFLSCQVHHFQMFTWQWMCITRSVPAPLWEWRAQDLQWKGEELFVLDMQAPGGCGRPALLQLWDAPLPRDSLCYQSSGFRSQTMVHPCTGLSQSGTLTYKQKSEWQINTLKPIFMKLKVQLFRNSDDPYQYISDNTAASCSRLDFLSLLYHTFYLILA